MIRKDEFENIIKSKLSAEELAPPADMFDRIQSARKKKKKAWLWLLRKYAALLILLFGVAGVTIWIASSPESVSEELVQPSNEQKGLQKDEITQLKNDRKAPATTKSLEDLRRIDEPYNAENMQFSDPSLVGEIPVEQVSELISSSETEVQAPINDELTASDENISPNDSYDAGEWVIKGDEDKQDDEEVEIDTADNVAMDVSEKRQMEQGKEVLPGRKIPSKWAITSSLLMGGQQSIFYGNQDLASINRQSTQVGLSRGIDIGIRYHLSDVWSVQTGIRVLSTANEINHQWESKTVEYQIEKETYTIYDPLLPPRTLTRIDTVGQSTIVQQNEINGSYVLRRISLPFGISRSWYMQKWGFTAGTGLVLNVLERRNGSVLSELNELTAVQKNIGKSSISSAWTTFEINRRLGHQSWIYAGPLITFDLDKSGVIEGLERRETFLLWNMGLCIGL